MPVFGAGKDIAARTWQSVFRQLLAMGLVRVDHGAFGALKLEEGARAVFKREREVFFRKDRTASERRPKRAAQAERRSVLSGSDDALFEALRAERTAIARSLSVPPYVVFPDTTLIAFATERPRTHKELLGISGVGQSKLERYGDAFLEVILGFEGSGDVGVHEVIALVDQSDAKRLGAGICVTVAEIQACDVANDLTVDRRSVDSGVPDLGRNGDFLDVEAFDEGVDRLCRFIDHPCRWFRKRSGGLRLLARKG
jgi:hypothetical protein